MTAYQGKIKAVFFDFMGTCLDWHSSVVKAFPPAITNKTASDLALKWRKQCFIANNQRYLQGLAPEDIDITLARVLDNVLEQFQDAKSHLDANAKKRLVEAWHSQPA